MGKDEPMDAGHKIETSSRSNTAPICPCGSSLSAAVEETRRATSVEYIACRPIVTIEIGEKRAKKSTRQ